MALIAIATGAAMFAIATIAAVTARIIDAMCTSIAEHDYRGRPLPAFGVYLCSGAQSPTWGGCLCYSGGGGTQLCDTRNHPIE
eukprot:11304311-Alexandrium_andersonii.AAC.1